MLYIIVHIIQKYKGYLFFFVNFYYFFEIHLILLTFSASYVSYDISLMHLSIHVSF